MPIFVPGNGIIERLLESNAPAANASLVWDRYFAVKERIKRPDEKSDELSQILSDFVKRFYGRTPSPLLAEYHQRISRALDAARLEHNSVSFKLQWRLASGLGIAHSSENGFAFEPNIGVPYLPGSSVKGLCRRTAAVLKWSKTDIDELLGPSIEDSRHRRQDRILIFLDALPRTWPKLEVDIVNCHHAGYYAGRVGRASETESPVPAFFLAVAPESVFNFRIASRTGASVEKGVQLLTEGLSLLGIGAKTAVGYGAMDRTK